MCITSDGTLFVCKILASNFQPKVFGDKKKNKKNIDHGFRTKQ